MTKIVRKILLTGFADCPSERGGPNGGTGEAPRGPPAGVGGRKHAFQRGPMLCIARYVSLAADSFAIARTLRRADSETGTSARMSAKLKTIFAEQLQIFTLVGKFPLCSKQVRVP
jgi:hypothetical protein